MAAAKGPEYRYLLPLFAVGAVLLVSPTPIAIGQERRPSFSSRADAVTVDILVTRRGKPVLGLSRQNFEVKDNGVLQEIETVSSEPVQLDIACVVGPAGRRHGDQLPALSRVGDALQGAFAAGDHVRLVPFGGAAIPMDVAEPAHLDFRKWLDAVPSQYYFKPMRDALVAAMVARHDHPGRYLVVLFSDGSDGRSWSTRDQVIELVRRTDSVIYVLRPSVSWLTGWVTFGFLEDLVAESGGRVISAEQSDVVDTLDTLLRESRSRYLLTYQPRGDISSGWHRLDVRLKGASGNVVARRGYFVE